MNLWTDIATAALATLGAVLGVINAWNAIRDRRVRLRVTPKWSLMENWSGLAIEVVNLSTFPVTISEVGFTIGRSRGKLPRRTMVLPHHLVAGTYPPVQLGQREALDLSVDVEHLGSLGITKAYARTASGEIVRGSSGALRQFIREGLPKR